VGPLRNAPMSDAIANTRYKQASNTDARQDSYDDRKKYSGYYEDAKKHA
jgi:hypothetical protein